MSVSEREGGEVLVCKGWVMSSFLDLFKGHMGSPSKAGE